MPDSRWLHLDWSRPIDDLAAEMGVKRQTAITYRSKLGKSPNPKPRVVDWSKVDWAKNNRQLASELGIAYDTVAARRHNSSAPAATTRAPRRDIGSKKPQCAPKNKAGQIAATEAAQQSPIAGKFETNVHAVDWMLVSPDGTEYRFKNLYEFVRQNPHLFAQADTMWKRRGGGRGTGGEYCNATAGILNIKGKKAKTWKGWTLK